VDYKSAIKKDMIVVNLVENTTLKRAELKKKLMFPTLNFLDKGFVVIFNMTSILYEVVQSPNQGNSEQERAMPYGQLVST